MDNFYINKDLFSKNIELIKQKNYELYNNIKSYQPEKQNIDFTKNNSYTYKNTNKTQTYYLHSKYNPERESERFIDNFIYNNNDLIICIKPGLGYHLNYFFKKNPETNIIIIEPDINILFYMLQTVDLSSAKNWNIFHSDKMQNKLQKYINEQFNILYTNNINYLVLPVIKKHYENLLVETQKYVTIILDKIISQNITLSHFGEIYHCNVINNIKSFTTNPGIKKIRNIFSDKPAMIVAAGPSLDYNISELKKHKNKFIIIAVDTVYKKLLDCNIHPHFTVSIDPQNRSYYHFKYADKINYFVICPTASNSVVKFTDKNCFFFISDYPLSKFLENVTETKGSLSTEGGSVSTVCLQLAEYLGCSLICMIGQDLSYPFNKTHCSVTGYEENIYSGINKFNTIENYFYNTSMSNIKLKGIKSNTVFTSHQLQEYYRWTENYIQNSDNTFINCTYDGVYFEECEHLSVEETIRKFNLCDFIIDDSVLKNFLSQYKNKKFNKKITNNLSEQLFILKTKTNAQRMSIKKFSDLQKFINSNYGIFELIKTLVYSKSIKNMRKLMNSDEYSKTKILVNNIISSIDDTIMLIKNIDN